MCTEPKTTLIQILEKTIIPDQNELEAAEKYLCYAAITDISTFIKLLSDVLAQGGDRHSQGANSQVARRAAGLHLKNHLTSKNDSLKRVYQQRWLALPEETRLYIKKNMLSAVGTEDIRPSAAAQCVAHVALAELPDGQWGNLVPDLVENVVNAQSTEPKREATLEAIGYICQEIDAEVLSEESNPILTAIIHGMRSAETSNHVRLAATQALLDSLEFVKANFDKENERNLIMDAVCEATRSNDVRISVTALQCLVKILSLYYEYMEPFMGQVLLPLTLEAIKSDFDEISLQGIEFWSNVSDEETDIAIEEAETGDAGTYSTGSRLTRPSRFYARGALQYLAPVLIQKLIDQDYPDVDDSDNWKPSEAAAFCLFLLSRCCKDEIVPHIWPFVILNVKNEDWRHRKAATKAFGSVLKCLEVDTLKPLVEKVMPTLIEAMYDSSFAVRDTAAWALSTICDIVPEEAINKTHLAPLMNNLVDGLTAEPRIAVHVCCAFTSLAKGAYENADCTESKQPETHCLSSYFDLIIQRLLVTADRKDAAQHQLGWFASEALRQMIKYAPSDCYVTVQKATMVIMERLHQFLRWENQVSSQADLLYIMLGLLRKAAPEYASQVSDALMVALLVSSPSSNQTVCEEEVLIAVSKLVGLLGEGCLEYMDSFKRYFHVVLKSHQEKNMYKAALGLIGDIFRELKSKAIPYCDEIMQLLLETLGDPSINGLLKPAIFNVFADISLAVSPDFAKYFDVVMQMLLQASNTQVDRSNSEMVEYLGELREGVLEAYTGIVQGLSGTDDQVCADLWLHVPAIVDFMVVVASDTELTDDLMELVAGLVGDLCNKFGARALPLLDQRALRDLLKTAQHSGTPRAKRLALWATKELRKLEKPAPPT